MRTALLLSTLILSGMCLRASGLAAADQAAPAVDPAVTAKTETIRLKNGKTVVGVVMTETPQALVLFNGAGNLALKTGDVIWRRPGGELEAAGAAPGGLVQRLQAQPAPKAVRLVGARAAQRPAAAGAIEAGSLAEMLQTPEAFLDVLAERMRAAGPGPGLIEMESIYRVRPVNKTEAYAQLRALEARADALLKPIARMSEKEIKAELTQSPYSNEETFSGPKYNRLSPPDTRRLLALRRLLHAFNKETYYTYAVNATFTDLLNPRQPLGDCNSSCALIYHLMWHAGYGNGVGLFLDVAGRHAVLQAAGDLDSRAYFGETTGGFLTDNPAYRAILDDPRRDPAEDRMTVAACLMDEGYPAGLSALQNLRLATILRVTSGDPWSTANFRHYFVVYLNNCLDARDEASVTRWSAVFDRIEGAGAFAKLPRTVQMR